MSSDGHIPRERIPLIFVADLLPQYRRDYTFYIALSFDPPGVWAPHLVFDNPSRAEPGINNSVTVQHLPLANFNRPGAQPSPPRAPAPARTARCTSRATVTLRHYTTQRDRPRWQASLARWLLAHHCALADARAQGSCQHDRDPADFQTTKGERFADRTRRFVRALPCRVARLALLACSHCTDSLPCSLPCCAGGKANRLIRARRDRVLWTRAPEVRAPL